MLTAETIAKAKRNFRYSNFNDISHEHDDCIRIAYAWLDAQTKLEKSAKTYYLPLKHIIEKWGGRYVSKSDVEIAAFLHPDMKGKYPTFNLSKKLLLPSLSRLDDIEQANTMPNYRRKFDPRLYKVVEDEASYRKL